MVSPLHEPADRRQSFRITKCPSLARASLWMELGLPLSSFSLARDFPLNLPRSSIVARFHLPGFGLTTYYSFTQSPQRPLLPCILPFYIDGLRSRSKLRHAWLVPSVYEGRLNHILK